MFFGLFQTLSKVVYKDNAIAQNQFERAKIFFHVQLLLNALSLIFLYK